MVDSDKFEKILDALGEHRVQLAVVADTLSLIKDQMKDQSGATRNLDERIKPIESHVRLVNGAARIVAALLSIVGVFLSKHIWK